MTRGERIAVKQLGVLSGCCWLVEQCRAWTDDDARRLDILYRELFVLFALCGL